MRWGPRWSQSGGGPHVHVAGGSMIKLVLPQGVPIPQAVKQDRRDSGVSAAVWEWL